MTDINIKLTADELAIIEQRRKEEQARIDNQAAKDKTRADRIAKEKAIEAEKIRALKLALREADTNGITFEDDHGVVGFFVGGNQYVIDIQEHFVTGGSGWGRTQNKGMKYHLMGSFNNYRHSWYKNSNTLIKKIAEYQEEARAKADLLKQKSSAADIALAHFKSEYPNADVKFEAGFAYGHGRTRRAAPDRIIVTTDRGGYEFNYHVTDGKVAAQVWQRHIHAAADEAVRKIILG